MVTLTEAPPTRISIGSSTVTASSPDRSPPAFHSTTGVILTRAGGGAMGQK
jgi:hypothetical protein